VSDASLISAVVIAIVAYVYLTIIRPARKEQAYHRREMRDLRPGDRVITTANIFARVIDIEVQESGPAHIHLEIADGVIVTAMPGAIYRKLEPEPAKTTEATPNSPSTDSRHGESPSETGRSSA